ncbi:hypothetical protein CONPUDRAFT_152864 [Coniophora puteana RWD-64-598 SS2]|uniref:Uncharacterized protein n=1 Tax=Coniophora puteana (strain RWD-64-598) TaxID=741705 RepID=A0A5M3MTV1_CONPW|nr:uncharacterized protein CONPUDRAFT_152864 [Coniophora puteana RWD-64-598 SS2]EIW81971.1 hypothetical protein CONPUDRAFT_152864 [Coniophora puteana RWD-64-598 SS2]
MHSSVKATPGIPAIRRHYHPLLATQSFAREDMGPFPVLSYETTFPLDESGPTPDVAATPSTSGVQISKPKGEVTRLKRDGYNLQDALGWSDDHYADVQRHLQDLATKHLNPTKTFKAQTAEAFSKLCDEAKKKYPELANYEDDWVAADFLSIYCKNKKARTKLN